MGVDNQKVWLVLGIGIVVLALAFLFIFPLFKGPVAGQATFIEGQFFSVRVEAPESVVFGESFIIKVYANLGEDYAKRIILQSLPELPVACENVRSELPVVYVGTEDAFTKFPATNCVMSSTNGKTTATVEFFVPDEQREPLDRSLLQGEILIAEITMRPLGQEGTFILPIQEIVIQGESGVGDTFNLVQEIVVTKPEEVCTNGLDDDFDYTVDCFDSDCYNFGQCRDTSILFSESIFGLMPLYSPVELNLPFTMEVFGNMGQTEISSLAFSINLPVGMKCLKVQPKLNGWNSVGGIFCDPQESTISVVLTCSSTYSANDCQENLQNGLFNIATITLVAEEPLENYPLTRADFGYITSAGEEITGIESRGFIAEFLEATDVACGLNAFWDGQLCQCNSGWENTDALWSNGCEIELVEICDNEIDDDEDGFTDCEDTSCGSSPLCGEFSCPIFTTDLQSSAARQGCEAVSGCRWLPNFPSSIAGRCISELNEQEGGPAESCADLSLLGGGHGWQNNLREQSCVTPCLFTDREGTSPVGDTCLLLEEICDDSIPELACPPGSQCVNDICKEFCGETACPDNAICGYDLQCELPMECSDTDMEDNFMIRGIVTGNRIIEETGFTDQYRLLDTCVAGQLVQYSCHEKQIIENEPINCPSGTFCYSFGSGNGLCLGEDEDDDGVTYLDDNCPRLANADQSDINENGVGDVCEVTSCGANAQLINNACQCETGFENANDLWNDGCEWSFSEVCNDGQDNDLDELIDLTDPDCEATMGIFLSEIDLNNGNFILNISANTGQLEVGEINVTISLPDEISCSQLTTRQSMLRWSFQRFSCQDEEATFYSLKNTNEEQKSETFQILEIPLHGILPGEYFFGLNVNTFLNRGINVLERNVFVSEFNNSIIIPDTCSNGFTESNEECDDSNIDNGDGCSDSCTIEDGWARIDGELTQVIVLDYDENGEKDLMGWMRGILQEELSVQDLIENISKELHDYFFITPLESCTPENGWEEGTTYRVTRDLSITDLNTQKRCFEPTADNIIIDCNGHSIEGPGNLGVGIALEYASNITIKNCDVHGFIMGAFVSWDRPEGTTGREDYISANNTFSGNTFSGNRKGVQLERSVNTIFESNMFCDNTESDFVCPSSENFSRSLGNSGSGNFMDKVQPCYDGWPTTTDYSPCSESTITFTETIAAQQIDLNGEPVEVLIIENANDKVFLENVYTTLQSTDSRIIKLTKIAYYLSKYIESLI
ncbi:hypothetical protein COV17_04345 [Candidatus Woesearchaeota archaeon CG10_big_fil_rev_8_21_14_0_10_36_11]|nr:MAG: hypothetical protein COV17_04345 [Candidatus Woesearchaeota archaeon CG10_big_fil_rev_8_21_14_0_10_36_11]